jgi:hypothetical protein
MSVIAEKIYNIDLVIEDIKKEPQTYSTILKEEVYNTTFQFSLRRKINILCKQGRIFKTTIPGTRFGQALLYVEPRKYKMLVEATRIGVSVYYFFTYEKIGRFYIKLTHYWELNNTEWIERNEEKTFFEGKILKFI